MKPSIVRLAVVAVRGWTRAYTWRMPPEIGEARCAEIQSDVWEFLHDSEGDQHASAAAHVLGRLLLGIPDDLYWRVEHDVTRHHLLVRRTLVVTAAGALVLVALWTLPTRFWQAEPSARTRVTECANDANPAQTTPQFRMRIINCAGLFFTPPRTVDSRSPQP
jgi:hypothetical protein